MGLLSRPALLLVSLASPATADAPIQILPGAVAKQAYYDCIFTYVADKTEWDVAANELLDIAEAKCEGEGGMVWLAILKDHPEYKELTDSPVAMAKDLRNAFVEQTRIEANRFIFEARHRPKLK